MGDVPSQYFRHGCPLATGWVCTNPGLRVWAPVPGGPQLLWRILQKATECLFFFFFFFFSRISSYLSPLVQISTRPLTQPSLALSQESCTRPSRLPTWGISRPGLCAGPRDLIVLKHSSYCLIFQCPLQFFVSNFIYAGIPLAVCSVPKIS